MPKRTTSSEPPSVPNALPDTPAYRLAQSRGFLTVEDVALIGEAVQSLDKDVRLTVVDLGAGSGTTLAAVVDARSGRPVIGCTFDISKDNLGWSFLFAKREYDLEPVYGFDATGPTLPFMFSARGKGMDWQWVERDSADDAVAYLPGWAVNLLMVDSSHEYEHTKREIAAWKPRMAADHRVWFHDYTDAYPGVRQAVNEAVDAGTLVIVKQAGLGVLARYVV